MTITYVVENSLYVNITNKCTNKCDFCIRKNGEGAYGSEPLWLEREPTREEILDDIDLREPEKYDELVFCGYGEPCCRLFDMLWVCEKLKKKYNIFIRVNTNGQSSLIYDEDTAPLFKGLVDELSISLNAPDSEEYDKVCHSVYGEKAYFGLLQFAREAKKYVDKVVLSVVDSALTPEEIETCRSIANDLGVELRVRRYIGKEE